MIDQSVPGPDEWAGGWNPRAYLRCLFCDDRLECGRNISGCLACGAGDGPAPLEVGYALDHGVLDLGRRCDLGAVLDWLSVYHQPIAPAAKVSLGRPVTPLVRQEALGPGVYVKNESLNPTWGHKDRLHEVAVGVARLFGARGVVTASTGNHGVSAVAHASAAGLPSVVFCHPQASRAAIRMITAYGGLPVQIRPAEAREALINLADDGWFPATSMDPVVSGRSNPYGAEGYKTLSLEVAAQLGELPGTVIIPTASGDTLYGIAKGFAEISQLTGQPMPRVVSAQPSGADPLARSLAAGHLVTVADAHSMALSLADPVTGRHALAALERWGGETVTVGEDAIATAVRRLASRGLLAEPSSAVALAGLWELQDAARLPVVLTLTGAGIKWPDPIAEIFPDPPLRSLAVLLSRLDQDVVARAR